MSILMGIANIKITNSYWLDFAFNVNLGSSLKEYQIREEKGEEEEKLD